MLWCYSMCMSCVYLTWAIISFPTHATVSWSKPLFRSPTTFHRACGFLVGSAKLSAQLFLRSQRSCSWAHWIAPGCPYIHGTTMVDAYPNYNVWPSVSMDIPIGCVAETTHPKTKWTSSYCGSDRPSFKAQLSEESSESCSFGAQVSSIDGFATPENEVWRNYGLVHERDSQETEKIVQRPWRTALQELISTRRPNPSLGLYVSYLP